ncbi:YncE family protein [Corticibacter populi]|uniref:YncE family protein n=1 Tax=Corticibacter populi TaxID=1550736 RepID=A0A3M6QTT7_9BURK|nr:YncE family protein [Corticibacter populi]
MQRQAVAPALYEIAYSARQNAIFVASAGGIMDKNGPTPRILRLDPATLAVQAEIPLERPGLGLVLDDQANRLYVGNAFHASVTVVDTQTNRVTGVVQLAEKVRMTDFDGKPIERYPHNLRELVLDKANERLFAPGIWISDSALYVMNTRTLALEKTIPGLGFGAAGTTLDAPAGKLYVSNMQGQLFTVDTRTLALEKTSEVAADQLLNLTLDRQKRLILATDQGSDNPNMVREKFAKLAYQIRGEGNRVVVIDPADGQVRQSVPTGRHPVALLIDEARHRLYVTNRGSGSVTVHDSRDYRLLHTFELPAHPNSLALDPVTGAVFVTIKNGEQDPKGSDESVARIQF